MNEPGTFTVTLSEVRVPVYCGDCDDDIVIGFFDGDGIKLNPGSFVWRFRRVAFLCGRCFFRIAAGTFEYNEEPE